MAGKQKLELTWIGKENRPRLEPRILLEDPEKSYHAAHRVSDNDIFDNRLIFGDNLLALKALEQEFTGKIKCIYIDPPYNTGSAFEHYDDGVEHSLWLSLIRDRLELLKSLLRDDGSIWINIDDIEGHYLKVLCDEVFGRKNFVANIVWQKRTSRENRAAIGSSHDDILVYAMCGPQAWKLARNRLPANDAGYSNPDNDERGPWRSIPFSAQGFRANQMYDIVTPTCDVLQPPKGRCWGATEAVYQKYRAENRVYFPKGGKGRPRIKQFQGEEQGLAPMTWWDASEAGDNEQAKKEILALFPEIEAFGTPKPEKLIARIITIATKPGDWVLDSFAGSGTTGAVAHKMGRKWVMIELGDHCHSHIIPRLKKVVNGDDPGGIGVSLQLLWESKLSIAKLEDGSELLRALEEAELLHSGQYERFERTFEDGHLRLFGVDSNTDRLGGGGFRYYRLAPSLLEQDEFGNWVINKKFNAEMLAEAVCKLEGFTYAPSEQVYWQHGYSTETDFIYVTTQTLSREQIQKLSDEVGDKRSLLVCCGAFRIRNLDDFPNLTLKKVPRAVMDKCEWGKDDYSLEIKSLVSIPSEPVVEPEVKAAKKTSIRKARKANAAQTATLFPDGDLE